MKKNLLTWVIVLCLTYSFVVPAFAAAASEDEKTVSSESYTKPGESLSSLDEISADPRLIRYASADENYAKRSAPTVIISKEDILVDHPKGIVVNDRSEDPLITAKTYNTSLAATSYIYGPYSNFSLSDDKMLIILNHLQSHSSTTAVNYNGTYCFKFESGSSILYMTVAGMSKVASGISTQPNAYVTSYLNSGNINMFNATAYKSVYFTWNNIDCYHWDFARFGTQAYYHSAVEIYMNSSVERAFSIDVNGYVIQGPYLSNISVKPTLALGITNTGTSSYYFGGYRYSGIGGTTATTNLGPLIQLGYKTVQVLGSVTSWSVSTVYTLYNNLVAFAKGSSGGRTTYVCQPVPLSSASKYSYVCSTPSPFAVQKAGDYCTIQIGLMGTKTSTTKFAVPVTFSVS